MPRKTLIDPPSPVFENVVMGREPGINEGTQILADGLASMPISNGHGTPQTVNKSPSHPSEWLIGPPQVDATRHKLLSIGKRRFLSQRSLRGLFSLAQFPTVIRKFVRDSHKKVVVPIKINRMPPALSVHIVLMRA
jgi:hypothetical protein